MRASITNSGCLRSSNAWQSCYSPVGVPVDTRFCLLMPLVELVATPVLLSTFIYQEKAAEPPRVHRNLEFAAASLSTLSVPYVVAKFTYGATG